MLKILKTFFGQRERTNINTVFAQDLHGMIKNGDSVTIIDVRSNREFSAGHIRGAKLIPLDQVGSRLEEIPTNHPVIFTCYSGMRSRKVTQRIADQGFSNVYNLDGGFRAWHSYGYPSQAA